jgi:DNA-binding transcriptional ArsR family regulator
VTATGARVGVEGTPRPDDDAKRRLDLVFNALADPTRRALLDRLLDRDGQRVSELVAGFGISRQAISKHLDVLAVADLVVVRRQRGGTRFFLNRMPMRQAQRLWIERFTRVQPRIDCY